MDFISYTQKGGSHFYNISRDSGILTAAEFDVALVEQQVGSVASRRDYLLAEATTRIAPLQDAVDLALATDAEAARLLAWKAYRVELSRVQEQLGYPAAVEWPVPPAE